MADAILYVAPFLFKAMIVLMGLVALLTIALTIFDGVEYLIQRKS